jgi:4-amino-4-deoxy-L-arabinose transferase-like glycosyltransferase
MAMAEAGRRGGAECRLMSAVLAACAAAVAATLAAIAVPADARPGWTQAGLPWLHALAGAGVVAWRSRLERATRLEDMLAAGALLAMSALLSGHLLLRLAGLGTQDDYAQPFTAWLVSMALVVAAATVPWRRPALSLDRVAVSALCALVLVAGAVRFWRLGSIPYVFGGDESSFALWAQGLTARFSNPFGFGFMSQPTLGIMMEGVAMKIAGASEAGARLVWAATGTLSVVPAYLLAGRIGGRAFGLGVAALVALYHFHIHYSRTALNNIADPLFMCLALWCLIVGIQRRSNWAWAGVGLACGLALYFYQGARLTPLVVVAVLAYACLLQGRDFRREALRGGVVALGVFLVGAAPMIQSALRFPQDFNARIGQISILMPGWLEREALASGRSIARILWDQVVHSALAFNWYADQSDHYGLQVPLLDPVFGVLFAIGLAYATVTALVSPRRWLFLPLVVWWWSGMLTGGAMTLSPPTSQRLLTLSVPACAFIVVAISWLVDLAGRLGVRLAKPPVIAACAAIFGVISLKTYFVDFTPRNRAGSHVGALATELARKLNRDGDVDKVYFLGAPLVFWGYPTFQFLSPHQRGEDILDPLRAPPPEELVGEGESVLFVVLPDRKGELAFIRAAFPGGEAGVLANPAAATPFADLYRVSRARR